MQENVHNTKESKNLGVFLWQYVVFELLYSVLSSYQDGIKENIKNKIDHLLVSDDVFSIGKSIIMNLIEFKPVEYVGEVNDGNQDQDLLKLVKEYGLDMKNIADEILKNHWNLIGQFLYLFSFDQQLLDQV